MILVAHGRDATLFENKLSYQVGQLSCSQFRQTVHTTSRTESGGRVRIESSGRQGLITIKASPANGTIMLEAWFDSLVVWRDSPDGKLIPDTDGVIGGRYLGRLSADGQYASEAVPFVPDEVAELVDLRGVMSDLLPRLPSRPLGRGESYADTAVGRFRRLPDSSAAGSVLERYEFLVKRQTQRQQTVRDSLAFVADETQEERGTFTWTSLLGLLRWERDVTVGTTIPAAGVVRRAVRSQIEQKISLIRLPSRGC